MTRSWKTDAYRGDNHSETQMKPIEDLGRRVQWLWQNGAECRDANRRDAAKRHLAMHLGMPLYTTLENQGRASRRYSSRRQLWPENEASGRHTTDTNKWTASVTPPVVTSPSKDAIYCASEPQDVTEHDAGKPTPTQDSILAQITSGCHRTRHGKPTSRCLSSQLLPSRRR
jgi:hypothetical protein